MICIDGKNYARKARNYASTKLIPDKPCRVRRKPGYLNMMRVYMVPGQEDKKANHNEEHAYDKYDIGQDIFFDKSPLPDRYFVNQLVLMPKNMSTIFAYWEVREDDFEHLKAEKNVRDDAVIVLYKGNEEFRRIKGLFRFGSYYINDVEGNKYYEAKIGFEDEYGNFFEIAHSTKVWAPSAKVSNRVATVWGLPFWNKKIGRIDVKLYSKANLPFEEHYRDEILDGDIVRSIEGDEEVIRQYIPLGASDMTYIEERRKRREDLLKASEGKLNGSSSLASSNLSSGSIK